MRKVFTKVLLMLSLLIGPSLGGILTMHFMAPTNQLTQPSVIVEVFDHSLDQFVPMWQKEVGRRFSNAVVVLCHGGDFVRGEWIVDSQPGSGHIEKVDDVLQRIKIQYPGRQIVLLACNTGHLKPATPDVYYAASSVWCVPDRALTPDLFENGDLNKTLNGEDKSRWEDDPDVVGNIFEFQKS